MPWHNIHKSLFVSIIPSKQIEKEPLFFTLYASFSRRCIATPRVSVKRIASPDRTHRHHSIGGLWSRYGAVCCAHLRTPLLRSDAEPIGGSSILPSSLRAVRSLG